ncbi:hypothetical protein RHMOL_Rhmol10G0265700 [Rhododendron molle]|uniref:Uncharacterized protein n=1 Tax=Rhododendron molle TaxID=49168 RepID=A0ACC0M689_RHOML|nr:hypothetical protein RHMOL_Rhmol10G0265700 [Rhododendron molle]
MSISVVGFCNNSFRALLLKLSFAATVYHIWLERNSRVFGGRAQSSEVVSACLEENLRVRISTWKHFPISVENTRLCHLWNLPIRILRTPPH